MNFLETLFGSPGKQGSTYNDNQLGLIDQIVSQIKGMKNNPQDISQNQSYQQGQGFLNNLFNDEDFFRNIEAPAMRQFNEQIAPDIANRFASMGSGGSTGSTAFRNQINREGANLAENLSANRTGMQQQGANQALQYGQAPVQNFMQMLQQALQPTQNTYSQPTGGLFGPLLGALGGGAAAGYGQQWGQSMYGNNQNNSFKQPENMSRMYPGQYPGTY